MLCAACNRSMNFFWWVHFLKAAWNEPIHSGFYVRFYLLVIGVASERLEVREIMRPNQLLRSGVQWWIPNVCHSIRSVITAMLLPVCHFTWNINYKEKCSFTLPLGIWHRHIWARATVALEACGTISLLIWAFNPCSCLSLLVPRFRSGSLFLQYKYILSKGTRIRVCLCPPAGCSHLCILNYIFPLKWSELIAVSAKMYWLTQL